LKSKINAKLDIFTAVIMRTPYFIALPSAFEWIEIKLSLNVRYCIGKDVSKVILVTWNCKERTDFFFCYSNSRAVTRQAKAVARLVSRWGNWISAHDFIFQIYHLRKMGYRKPTWQKKWGNTDTHTYRTHILLNHWS